MLIEEYQALNRLDKIAITKHAKTRLEERGIFPDREQWEDGFKTRREC